MGRGWPLWADGAWDAAGEGPGTLRRAVGWQSRSCVQGCLLALGGGLCPAPVVSGMSAGGQEPSIPSPLPVTSRGPEMGYTAPRGSGALSPKRCGRVVLLRRLTLEYSRAG